MALSISSLTKKETCRKTGSVRPLAEQYYISRLRVVIYILMLVQSCGSGFPLWTEWAVQQWAFFEAEQLVDGHQEKRAVQKVPTF